MQHKKSASPGTSSITIFKVGTNPQSAGCTPRVYIREPPFGRLPNPTRPTQSSQCPGDHWHSCRCNRVWTLRRNRERDAEHVSEDTVSRSWIGKAQRAGIISLGLRRRRPRLPTWALTAYASAGTDVLTGRSTASTADFLRHAHRENVVVERTRLGFIARRGLQSRVRWCGVWPFAIPGKALGGTGDGGTTPDPAKPRQ